jgi:Uma2 family endonuclease
MSAVEKLHMSYGEYLAFEEKSAVKHEYLRGEVFAMAGGTPEHAALCMAIGSELRAALRNHPCRVFDSNLKVRVHNTDLSTYPDVTVVCGKFESAVDDPNAVVNPLVLVEVLSDSSESYDRGEKFAHYRRLGSLREYVLVSQRSPRIEVFSRKGAKWELTEAGPGESILIPALEISLSVDELYRDAVDTPR